MASKVVTTAGSRVDRFTASKVAATMDAAAATGLMEGAKTKRISGRAHPRLFAAAAERTGLAGSELLEFALARVALEDDFIERLESMRGTVSRDIDLEF